MPESLDTRELSDVIRKLVSSLVGTGWQISLSDKLSEVLDLRGSRFLGIVVSNYPEEYAEELKSALRNSLRKCVLDGRNMWVHEEEVDGSYNTDGRKFEIYRSLKPYNLLLVYDPMSRLERRSEFYSIDFMAFLECERMARRSREDKFKG